MTDITPMSMKELITHGAAIDRHKREHLDGRGLVRWDAELRVFYLYDGEDPKGYGVDAERLSNNAELVDWIFHLRGKVWFTNQHLSDLLDLIQENLGHPRNWK